MNKCQTNHPLEPSVRMNFSMRSSTCITCVCHTVSRTAHIPSVRQSALAELSPLTSIHASHFFATVSPTVIRQLLDTLLQVLYCEPNATPLSSDLVAFISSVACQFDVNINTNNSNNNNNKNDLFCVQHVLSSIVDSIFFNNSHHHHHHYRHPFRNALALIHALVSKSNCTNAFAIVLANRVFPFVSTFLSFNWNEPDWHPICTVLAHIVRAHASVLTPTRLLPLLDTNFPSSATSSCRRSATTETSYLRLIHALLSSATPATNNNNNIVLLSSSKSPFLSILRKTLVSASKSHSELALSLVPFISSSSFCNTHSLFDYVIEALRSPSSSSSSPSSMCTLNAIRALAPYVKPATKWTYALPVVLRAMKSHTMVHTSCLQAAVYMDVLTMAFKLAPVQTFSTETVQQTCAFIKRLHLSYITSSSSSSSSSCGDENVHHGIEEEEGEGHEKVGRDRKRNKKKRKKKMKKRNRTNDYVIDSDMDLEHVQQINAYLYNRRKKENTEKQCFLTQHHTHHMKDKQNEEEEEEKTSWLSVIHDGIQCLHVLLSKYNLCTDALPFVLDICSLGASHRTHLIPFTMSLFPVCVRQFKRLIALSSPSSLSSPQHYYSNDTDSNHADRVRTVGQLMTGNVTQSWACVLHGKLETLEMAMALLKTTNNILITFQMFASLMDPAFLRAGCVSFSDAMAIRKWCWRNLPVRLAFCLENANPSPSSSSLSCGTLKIEFGELKKSAQMIISEYLIGLVFPHENEHRSFHLKTETKIEENLEEEEEKGEEEEDERRYHEKDLVLTVTTEKSFLHELSNNNNDNNNSSSNVVAHRLLQMGIFFSDVQLVCRPDLIISSLSSQLMACMTKIICNVHDGGDENARRQSVKFQIIELLRCISVVCKHHHMIFPVNCLSDDTARVFISVLSSSSSVDCIDVDVDLFCKFISQNGISDTFLHASLWDIYALSHYRQSASGNDDNDDDLQVFDILISSIHAPNTLISALACSRWPLQIVECIRNVTACSAVHRGSIKLDRQIITCHIISLLANVGEEDEEAEVELKEEKEDREEGKEKTMRFEQRQNEIEIDMDRICAFLDLLTLDYDRALMVGDDHLDNHANYQHRHHHHQFYDGMSMSNLIPLLVQKLSMKVEIMKRKKRKCKDEEIEVKMKHRRDSAIQRLHASILRFLVISSTSCRAAHRRYFSLTAVIPQCISYLCHTDMTMTNNQYDTEKNQKNIDILNSSLFSPAFEHVLSVACVVLTLCLRDRDIKVRDECFSQLCAHVTIPRLWDFLLEQPLPLQQISTQQQNNTTTSSLPVVDYSAVVARITNTCHLFKSFVSYADRKDENFMKLIPFISNPTISFIMDIMTMTVTTTTKAITSPLLSHVPYLSLYARRSAHALMTKLLDVDGEGFKLNIRADIMQRLVTKSLLNVSHPISSTVSLNLIERLIMLGVVDDHLVFIHNHLLEHWKYWDARGKVNIDDDSNDDDDEDEEKEKMESENYNENIICTLSQVFLLVSRRIKQKGILHTSHLELVPESTKHRMQKFAADYSERGERHSRLFMIGSLMLWDSR